MAGYVLGWGQVPGCFSPQETNGAMSPQRGLGRRFSSPGGKTRGPSVQPGAGRGPSELEGTERAGHWPSPAEGARPPAQRRTVPGPQGPKAESPGVPAGRSRRERPSPAGTCILQGRQHQFPHRPSRRRLGVGRLRADLAGSQASHSPWGRRRAVSVCLSRRRPLCVCPLGVPACTHVSSYPCPHVPTSRRVGAGREGARSCGLAPPAKTASSSRPTMSAGPGLSPHRPPSLCSPGRWLGRLGSPSLSVLQAGHEETSRWATGPSLPRLLGVGSLVHSLPVLKSR